MRRRFRYFLAAVLTALAGLAGCSAGDDGAGSPTITELVDGDGQFAAVDAAVAIAPRIRVLDRESRPVAGVAVDFAVIEGDGRVDGATATTDGEGLAAAGAWVLGPTPGRNRLVAEVPGLAPVFFEATGLADERGSFIIDGGDRQTARVGTALPTAPTIRLLDGDGAPVVGAPVTFEVGTGGGTVEGGSTRTGDDGRAAVGGWRLGPEVGEQTLIAISGDLPPLTLRALAVAADAPVLNGQDWITRIGRVWDMAWLPDGTMLFTERDGRVRAVNAGTTRARVVLESPDDLAASTQSGMLGIAVDPDYETNRYVYTFMSSNRGGSMDNRVRRWTFDGDELVEDRDILSGISWGSNGGHSGGRIRFGPDGMLWVTSGDTRSATVPQDPAELGGKILRITRDGDPAPDNPSFGDGVRPEIFFMGVRNPQGITFHPDSGAPFICEHGPNNDDEITRIEGGGNGGWNPNDGRGNYNGYDGALMSDPSFSNLVQPAFVLRNSQGMSGCDFLRGATWGAWDRSLLVGLLSGERILIVPVREDGQGVRGDAAEALDPSERIRSITQGPDGAVYVAIDGRSGRILRLTPE